MTLKVSELIELLQKCPADAEVYTEGCDCTGEAVDVDYDKSLGHVEITRHIVDRNPPTPEPRYKPGTVDVDHDVMPPSKRWGS